MHEDASWEIDYNQQTIQLKMAVRVQTEYFRSESAKNPWKFDDN